LGVYSSDGNLTSVNTGFERGAGFYCYPKKLGCSSPAFWYSEGKVGVFSPQNLG